MLEIEQKEVLKLDQEQIARVNEAAKQVTNAESIRIEDIPILRESPWLLGGADAVAQ